MNKKIVIPLIIIFLIVFFFTGFPYILEISFNSIYKTEKNPPSEKAKQLVKKIFIADLHCDALLWNRDLLKKNTRGHVDVPRLIEGNVSLQTFSIVSQAPATISNYSNSSSAPDLITALNIVLMNPVKTWFSFKERALYQAEKFKNFSKNSNGMLTLIVSSSNLSSYIENKKNNPEITAGLLSIEGIQVLEKDINNLEVMYNSGFRMISLTHFTDNFASGSAHGKQKGGLTDKGKEIIRLMNNKKIIIDLAHSSPQSIDEVLKITTKPVIVSHTGVKGICDNVRNISDAHIDAIARNGGIIGIAYIPFAMCGENFSNIIKSIRYLYKRTGIKHIALGSDYDGMVAAPFDASGMAVLADALIKDGFTDEEIGLIMGGNVLRFLKENLPEK